LGHIEACSELLLASPQLLFVKDKEGRMPLDWAWEKMYFLREELETAPLSDCGKFQKMADDAVSCIHFCLNFASALDSDTPCVFPVRSVQIALASGELGLAIVSQEMLPEAPDESVWLGGLAGFWKNCAAVESYVDFLEENFGVSSQSEVFGSVPTKHVFNLWFDKKITTPRALWFQSKWGKFDPAWASQADGNSTALNRRTSSECLEMMRL
jgi:hypothetical protein